ncbi:LuxR C-terminal-related transcriptional regulator [Flavobacteriaceae bacterium]|mgnify:CR=1 FL=1|nr:LuxR C-terminal-related transcriptional regulator [Flavobacteriaceae bacterium]MDA9846932.1 LuxR C-terminal-related transcriptional regulator [Flavobacteriaceae bacterium]
MKKIRLHVFLLIVSFWQNTHTQDIASVNDSLFKYTFQDPQKALEFGFKAIENSDFNIISWDLFETNYLIGQTLFYLNFEKESFDYLIQALSIFEKLPKEKRLYKQINKPPWILVTIGNGFYNTKQYDKAKAYYIEAIENFNLYETNFEEDKIYGLNSTEGNLALINLELREFDKSLEYYNQILDRRKLLNKVSDLIFSYNQFINLYLKQDNIERAKYYLALSKKSFNYDLREGNFKSDPEIQLQYAKSLVNFADYYKEKGGFRYALELYSKAKGLKIIFDPTEHMRVNISIADCYQGLNEFSTAEQYLLENLNSTYLSLQNRIDSFKSLAKVYENMNQYENLISVKDSIIHYSNQSLSDPYNTLDNLENIILLSEKQIEINESQQKFKRALILFIPAVLILILIVATLRINNNLQNERSKRLELEKKNLKEELNKKRRELFSKTNFIMQRNEYLQRLKDNLSQDNNIPQVHFNKIKRDISSLITAEATYDEFDKKFIEVFPDFYKKMNGKYELSKVDFRLIAYIKMNKSNNEIAQISGISLRTVQSQRYRLSKKLNLKKNQNLNAFIFSI